VHIDPSFYFVSSWSAAEVEQSGQWSRYGDDNRGIRITMEECPFDFSLLNLDIDRPTASGKKVGYRMEDVWTPFNLKTMFGNGYVLYPDDADMRQCFGGRVVYVDNPEQWAARCVNSSEQRTTIFGQGTRIARVKSKMWEDQCEFRFVLCAIKGPSMNYEASPAAYEKVFLDQLENDGAQNARYPTNETFIDLPLSRVCLDSLVVTLGPKITDADRRAVSAALEEHAPHAKVRDSALPLR
jgi:hypothetical protein